jgi:predicted enzyme related to lactoylglutathione lyase
MIESPFANHAPASFYTFRLYLPAVDLRRRRSHRALIPMEIGMAKVTGVGGIFFKCADPKALADWYRENLGLDVEDWGGVQFQPSTGVLVWTPFHQDTDNFAPSTREFMLNFVVDDLDGMIAQLEAKGIAILKREDSDYGRFAWLLDPAGIKIELWEAKG